MLEQKMIDFAMLGASWVLWLLVGLSVLCVGVAVERAIYLAMNSAPAGPFEEAITAYLGGGPRDQLEKRLAGMRGIEPRVLLAGLSVAATRPDAAQEAMAGTLTFEKLRLERGLLIIGTVASTAPFIGLFGTVLGIMQAFQDLAVADAESTSAVMAGISHALVATAIGLLVAIPAVVLYNTLVRRVKSLTTRVDSLGALVLSRLRADQAA
jgi:biopolymer transport protein ExbB